MTSLRSHEKVRRKLSVALRRRSTTVRISYNNTKTDSSVIFFGESDGHVSKKTSNLTIALNCVKYSTTRIERRGREADLRRVNKGRVL